MRILLIQLILTVNIINTVNVHTVNVQFLTDDIRRLRQED
jgi:hypothetical protein